jgi:hypothetical protein
MAAPLCRSAFHVDPSLLATPLKIKKPKTNWLFERFLSLPKKFVPTGKFAPSYSWRLAFLLKKTALWSLEG